MTVTTYEKSERGRVAGELVGSLECEWAEGVIILPIPSTAGDKIRGADISLSDFSERDYRKTAIFGYALPPPFAESLRRHGALVYDLIDDEEFLSENARLTAEAALGIILGSEGRSPKDIRFGVAGYGRIGKRLVNLLLFLGAEVVVYTTSERHRLELLEAGVSAEAVPRGVSEPLALDILINTAPSRLFSSSELSHGSGNIRIIELASGENFDEGVVTERYPALPARVYPVSAGRAIFSSVSRALLGGGNG